MLEVGVKAPNFALKDKNGRVVKLSELLGRRAVIYFYPKDNTPGCIRQAQAFAAAHDKFISLGIPVIGISKDSESSHMKFADKYELPFVLLSDPQLEAIKAYDVWKEKNVFGKTSMGVVRTTYLIDHEGIVEKVWPRAKPDINAKEILEYLEG